MKNNIPCAVIQDLFPSYIDKLTSDVTCEQIQEHLSECDACRQVFNTMKDPTAEPEDKENKQEIDFLKKTRKKTKKIALGSALSAFAIVTIVIFSVMFAGTYLIGSYMSGNYVECEVSVEGNILSLSGSIKDEGPAIKSVEFTRDGEIVTVLFKGVQRGLIYNKSFEEQYISDEDIKEVWFGDRVVWSNGESISAITAAVYNTRHPYVGDMSANNDTAKALNISHLGEYKNMLGTSEEPYSWKMIFHNSFSSQRKRGMEDTLKKYAYVLLATIDNLGEVSYEYVIDAKTYELTVTQQEASEFAGENIKNSGQDVNKLQSIMKKTGLANRPYFIDDFQLNSKNSIRLFVSTDTTEISGVAVSYYVDENLCGTQVSGSTDAFTNTNPTQLKFYFIPDDFCGGEWEGRKEIKLGFAVFDKDGNKHAIEETFDIAAEFGGRYYFNLSLDAGKGYVITQ